MIRTNKKGKTHFFPVAPSFSFIDLQLLTDIFSLIFGHARENPLLNLIDTRIPISAKRSSLSLQ